MIIPLERQETEAGISSYVYRFMCVALDNLRSWKKRCNGQNEELKTNTRQEIGLTRWIQLTTENQRDPSRTYGKRPEKNARNKKKHRKA